MRALDWMIDRGHPKLWYSFFKKNLDFRERKGEGGKEGERERMNHQFVIPLIYAFIGWFLFVP